MKIDDRSLAAVRVAVAALVLVSVDFVEISDWPVVLLGTFKVATYGFLLAVFVGYRAKLAALAAWVVISLQVVYELATVHAGVVGLVALLACLRCSGAWSVDSAMNWVDKASVNSLTWGSGTFLAQLVMIIVAALLDGGQGPLTVAVAAFIIALVLLMPTALVDGLARYSARYHGNQLRIYYDKDCGFCLKTCLLFRTFLLLGNTPIRPAQSDPDIGPILEKHNSWVVVDRDGSIALHWHAVLLVMRRSVIARPLGLLLTAVGMGHWGRGLYKAIGNSRGLLSKISAAVLPLRSEPAPATSDWRLFAFAWLIASLLVNANLQFAGLATAFGLVRLAV